jgi:hypothetical protein
MREISSWKTRIVKLRLVFLISGIVVYKESFSKIRDEFVTKENIHKKGIRSILLDFNENEHN